MTFGRAQAPSFFSRIVAPIVTMALAFKILHQPRVEQYVVFDVLVTDRFVNDLGNVPIGRDRIILRYLGQFREEVQMPAPEFTDSGEPRGHVVVDNPVALQNIDTTCLVEALERSSEDQLLLACVNWQF